MPGAADHFARFMSHNSSESYQQLVSGRADCDGDMLQCDNNNKRQPDSHDTDTEEDIEIELVEEEAPFLKGQGRMMNNLSPVRIVKNPDGSLAQAAMMQGALAKERRENKMIERQQADNEVDTSKGRSWADPMPKNAPALASDSQSGGPGKVRLSCQDCALILTIISLL